MKNLFLLPLTIIAFFFECYNSPLSKNVFRWWDLFKVLVKTRIFSIYKKNMGDINVKFLDIQFCAPDYSTFEYLFREIFVKGEYYDIDIKDINVVYDCGANIGMTTVFFKIVYPNAMIFSFEPNPMAFAFLNKNIQLNNLADINIFPVALSDYEGELELFYSPGLSMTGSFYNNRSSSYTRSVVVKTAQLSNYLSEFGSPDLLKIDVEGAEILIIKDLVDNYDMTKIYCYFIEYHNSGDLNKFATFIKKLPHIGYNFQSKSIYSKNKVTQDIVLKLIRI